jgi:SPP1 gp7 family putative phage head morphogenesis protein
VASIIEIGFAQGRTQEEIADDLLPLFQGVASSARRVARDETVRIANELKFEADERMGELLVGYQVRAVLDERTRPKHRERNGTIYYKDPKPGQRGYDSMPRPPLESPRDGSKLAYFCRCSLSAILRPIPKREREAMVSPPTPYRDRDRRLVPDPQVYSEWFRKADDKRRKIAVGPRRYAEVKDLIRGQRPSWEHFLDPETGEMMKLDDLRRETVDERRDRVRQTRNLIARRPSLATLAAR